MHSGRTTGFQFGYDPSGNLTNLLDGNNSRAAWGYDQFGRVTSKLDTGNSEILRFNYDSNNRLLNSGPSQTSEQPLRALPLEQFWGVSESTLAAAGLAADGPRLWRDGDSEGQSSRAAAIRGSDGKSGERRNDESNGNRFGGAGVWGKSNSAKNFKGDLGK